MEQMQIYEHEHFGKIRTLTKDGDIWFVATDICDALDIDVYKRQVQYYEQIDNRCRQTQKQIQCYDFRVVLQHHLKGRYFHQIQNR